MSPAVLSCSSATSLPSSDSSENLPNVSCSMSENSREKLQVVLCVLCNDTAVSAGLHNNISATSPNFHFLTLTHFYYLIVVRVSRN